MSIRLTCLSTVALLLVILPARAASPQEVKDDLPTPPEGKTWKLVWHDEFDGTKLDETKWDVPPDGRRRDGWWMPQGDRARRQGAPGHQHAQGGRQVHRRLRRGRRASSSTPSATTSPASSSRSSRATGRRSGSIGAGVEQGRRRRPGRHGDRHHGEAVARRPGAAHPPLGRLRQGPQVRRQGRPRCPA